MNPFSDIPDWMLEVEVDAFPRLYLSHMPSDDRLTGDGETWWAWRARVQLWRWSFFLEVGPSELVRSRAQAREHAKRWGGAP